MWQRAKRFFSDDWTYYRQSPAKKPILKQAREMYLLYKYYDYIPYQYVKHCLYLESFKENIYDYIPPELVHRLQHSLNPPDEVRKVIDKNIFSAIMNNSNLPTINQLFTIKPGPFIQDNNNCNVTFSDFASSLGNYKTTSTFIIKPVSGYQGLGIHKVSICGGAICINNQEISEQQLHSLLFLENTFTEYLVQQTIPQHDLLNRIYPSSVNTVRIDTLVLDNEIVNNGAVLRVGNNGMFVDNWAQGGLIVPIDLATGRLGRFGKTKIKYGRRSFEVHPATGFRFSETQLPFWTEVLDLVCSAAQKFLPLQLLGWDVAITNNGPLIIEANQDYDVFLTQEAIGGLRRTPIGRKIIRELNNIRSNTAAP